ncbi:GNAT family N-acetyltransferase [Paenibacillus sp. FSL M7-0802]|uniref:GNAT family N-acetyltransferase n=1 Tax=Paenibacillus TaxID=44249 RepID=UPI00096E564B|nr:MULTISPECIES: GNAT family N-acetyltransferase [Paenibacillus]MBP1173831.1 ribosomal protein S18 acetylase RimI-like enzyme [Paenibacillus sp. PvR133]OMF73920.1 GNAT family N-acetyltransferase [Paenibacillus peoriae]
MSFLIRNAKPDDLNNLTELMYEYIVGFYQNPRPPIEKIHNLIQTLFEQQNGIQFVAEQNGELIGFATLFFTFSTMKADKITVMNDLFVLEPFRDTEVESQLFLECQKYSQNYGYAHMTWITSTENKRAQIFFKEMDAVQGRDWVHFSS